MSKVQVIEQDGKRLFYVVPADIWERVKAAFEDAEDAAAYAKAVARDDGVRYPAAVALAIADGAHRRCGRREQALCQPDRTRQAHRHRGHAAQAGGRVGGAAGRDDDRTARPVTQRAGTPVGGNDLTAKVQPSLPDREPVRPEFDEGTGFEGLLLPHEPDWTKSSSLVTRMRRSKSARSIRAIRELTPYDPAEDLSSDPAIADFMAGAFETNDPGFIAHALGVVARAKGMTQIASQTGQSREQLYRSVQRRGQPDAAHDWP